MAEKQTGDGVARGQNKLGPRKGWRAEDKACLFFSVLLMVTLWPSLQTLLPGLEDEGTVVSNASRLLYGELPYRDYFLRLPPLTDWTIGLWLKAFGNQLMSLRAYFCFSALVSTLALTRLSFRHLKDPLRWLAPLWFILVGPQAWPMASFAWDASAWALTAILILDTADTRPRYLIVGLLTAATGMALHTKGAALWLALILGLSRLPSRSRRTGLLFVNIGIALPTAVFLAFLASYGAVGQFFHQTVGFNAGAYLQAQGHSLDLSPVSADFQAVAQGIASTLAHPSMAAAFWVPKAIGYWVMVDLVGFALYYPLVILGTLVLLWRTPTSVSIKVLLLTLTFASLLDLGRPNRYHLNFHLAFYAFLVCLLIDSIPKKLPRRILAALLTANVLLVGWSNLEGWSGYQYLVVLPRGRVYTQSPGEARLLYDLSRITQSGEEQDMFAFPDASLTAWLLGKRNPTGITASLPLFYTDEMFREAKRRIEKRKAEWLLFKPVGPGSIAEYKFDPQKFAKAQHDLCEFLTQGYDPVASWGPIVLYRRRSLGP